MSLLTEELFFLDEIGDMPLGMQAKILRVLEDKIIRRIGGSKDISVDVRIVSATNKNLLEAIEEGNLQKRPILQVASYPNKTSTFKGKRGRYNYNYKTFY